MDEWQIPISTHVSEGDVAKLDETIARVPSEHQQNAKDLALYYAVVNNKESLVAHLLEQQANLNVIHKKGRTGKTTCLHSVCSSPQAPLSLLRLLLKHGADTNIPDENGNTPLLTAALRGQTSFITELLEHGANVTHKNSQGNTVIHSIVTRTRGSNTRELIELLVSKGANLFEQNNQGDTPLLKAVRQDALEEVKAILSIIREKYNDEEARRLASIKNSKGFTPLHEAAIWSSAELLKVLVSSGLFDVNETDNEGNSPLVGAGSRKLVGTIVRTGDVLEHARILLGAGADPNSKDAQGNTPLHRTDCSKEYLELLLAQPSVDLTVRNSSGYTSLITHALAGKVHNVEAILAERVSRNVPLEADEVTTLSELKVPGGGSLFHMLAQHDSIDCLEKLLEANVKLDINCVDFKGETVIDVALKHHSVNFIAHLIKTFGCKLDPNKVEECRNSNGDSILHTAVASGKLDAVKALLDAGVNVHIEYKSPDEDDEEDAFVDSGQPIHVACIRGHVDILRYLIERGADLYSQRSPGKNSPLHYAVHFNHPSIVDALLEHVDVDRCLSLLNSDGMTVLDELKIREAHLDPHIPQAIMSRVK